MGSHVAGRLRSRRSVGWGTPRKAIRLKPGEGKRVKSARAERSEAQDAVALRGRLSRRAAAERTQAVLTLRSGKPSVDRIALRVGVDAGTVERRSKRARAEKMTSVATRLRSQPQRVLGCLGAVVGAARRGLGDLVAMA